MKRLISVMLIITMLMSMVSVTSFASEVNNTPNAEVLNDDYNITASNSMGNLIATAIESNEYSEEDYASCILDVEINESTVKVKYSTYEDCTILVALYDENTNQLLASGKTTVLAQENEAEVFIETDEMPQAYVLKAFMLDESLQPIASAYTDLMHTSEMRALLDMKVGDFEQDEVLNLDESNNTNFAVYNESVIKFSMTEDKNILKSYDEVNGVYVFEKADKEILNLKAGDTVSCDDDVNSVIIIKVASVTVEGTTVTITEEETSLEEVFDYVKIETEQGLDEAEFDDSTMDEDFYVVEDEAETYDRKTVESVGATSITEKFEANALKFSTDDDAKIGGVDFSASISVGLTATLDIYISRKQSSVNFELSSGINIEVSLEKEIPKESEKKLGYIAFSPIAGVYIDCTPKLVVKASCTLEFTFTAGGSIGFNASISNGESSFSPMYNLEYDASFGMEGELFAGVDLGPTIAIITEDIASADLEAVLGGRFTAEMTLLGKDDSIGTREESVHCCEKCIEGKMELVLEISVELEFFNKKYPSDSLIETAICTTPFYYSYDYNKFGWREECPYKDYLTKVTVVDRDGKAVYGAEVRYSTDCENDVLFGTTNSDGEVIEYLPNYRVPDGVTDDPVEIGYLFKATKDNETKVAGTKLYLDTIQEVEIKMGRDVRNLIIKAVDTEGNPVNGAMVMVSYASNTMNSQGTTDADGLCTMEVENYATYDVTVMAGSRMATKTIEVTVVDTITYEIVLPDDESNIEPTTVPITTEPSTEPVATEPTTDPTGQIASGSCGENAFWTLSDDGCLTISGSGKMSIEEEYSPWYGYRSQIESLKIEDGITDIEGFSELENLTEVSIPDSVTTIWYFAFSECTSLEEIYIPDSVGSVLWGTFCGCVNLKSVRLSDRAITIDRLAFLGCLSLTDVVLPKGLERIGDMAFCSCEQLKSIEIPSLVEEIGYLAFAYCGDLEITFTGDCPEFDNDVFVETTVTAYYPADNSTWTEDKLLSYEGEVTWIPYDNNAVGSGIPEYINVSSDNKAYFEHLYENTDYIIAVVKSSEVEDVLSADNLLYIDQLTADENGCISLDYIPREETDSSEVLIFGRQKVELLAGDVNLDGVVSIVDCTNIQKYASSSLKLSDYALAVADSNKDGIVNIVDATNIQKYLVGLDKSNYIGTKFWY